MGSRIGKWRNKMTAGEEETEEEGKRKMETRNVKRGRKRKN